MSHHSAVHVTYFLSCLLSLSLEDDREWSRFRGNKRWDYFQPRVETLRIAENYLD